MTDIHPDEKEKEFLTVAYNRFLEIYQEISSEAYWKKDDYYRFSRQKEIFFVFQELSQYQPIKDHITHFRNKSIGQLYIQSVFFKFLRNIFAHFSFFDRYDDVWISLIISGWNKNSKYQSIKMFIEEYNGHEPIKYRIWDTKIKKMTYLSIKFPTVIDAHKKIYLHELCSEKEGIMFSANTMWKYFLSSQIEEIKSNE